MESQSPLVCRVCVGKVDVLSQPANDQMMLYFLDLQIVRRMWEEVNTLAQEKADSIKTYWNEAYGPSLVSFSHFPIVVCVCRLLARTVLLFNAAPTLPPAGFDLQVHCCSCAFDLWEHCCSCAFDLRVHCCSCAFVAQTDSIAQRRDMEVKQVVEAIKSKYYKVSSAPAV